MSLLWRAIDQIEFEKASVTSISLLGSLLPRWISIRNPRTFAKCSWCYRSVTIGSNFLELHKKLGLWQYFLDHHLAQLPHLTSYLVSLVTEPFQLLERFNSNKI